MFLEILSDQGNTFPFEEIGMNPPAPTAQEERKAIFIDFIVRLLYFWSGLKAVDNRRMYQVIIRYSTGLPTSSTCFTQLKLSSIVATKDKLYRDLVKAVYNVERGVGLYGGGKYIKR